jgi:pimeloyl-ACP methyl ester carboxylesterase
MMQKVISKDGTQIAYEKQGQGPAVILVDGALCYRSFGPMHGLANLLASQFTVTIYDRRGRGESGDNRPFAVEREVEDIEALIDEGGQSAYLFGLSSGAALGLEAAIKLGGKVNKLAMYEAPYNFEAVGHQELVNYSKKLDGLLAANDRGGAAELFMQFVGNPAQQIDGMRQLPMWQMFEAVAPTLAYDGAVIVRDRPELARRSSSLQAQVLVMNGGAGAPFMYETARALADIIPHAQHLTLEGQRHDVDVQVLAPVLIEFFEASNDAWLKDVSHLHAAKA